MRSEEAFPGGLVEVAGSLQPPGEEAVEMELTTMFGPLTGYFIWALLVTGFVLAIIILEGMR